MDRKTILEYNFKTEICNNWRKTGECPYKHCYFAHGNSELMQPGEYTRFQRQKKEAKRLIKKEKRKAKRAANGANVSRDSSRDNSVCGDFENVYQNVYQNVCDYAYETEIPDEYIYDRYWNSIHSLILDESVNVLSV